MTAEGAVSSKPLLGLLLKPYGSKISFNTFFHQPGYGKPLVNLVMIPKPIFADVGKRNEHVLEVPEGMRTAQRGGPRNSDNRVRWKNDCWRRRPQDEEKQTEPVFGGVQGQGGDGGDPGGGDAFRAVLPVRRPPESDHEVETAGG